ncbi:MAG: nicotinate phosphoribosyltransferase [bacterium]|nr:nicotinate phosphoribosyltransferase [bacterium]
MRLNQILNFVDSYKVSHAAFEAKGTEYIYSNLTPRTSKYFVIPPEAFDGRATFFGLQYFIKHVLIDLWDGEFFKQPKEKVIKAFKRRCDTHLGKDNIDMGRFEKLHDLQYLPIVIKALPEGVSVPMKVPFLTIKNTHPEFSWLTNYLETALSCIVWKPCNSATILRGYKKIINEYADSTVGDRNHTPFALHGFECRGMNGYQDAALAGAAVALSTCGSDTILAIDLLEQYYNADAEKEMILLSVPASEHAVSSLGTSVEDEFTFFKRAITEYYPRGIVSIVSDTFDYFKFITEYASKLKNEILNRPLNEFGLSKVVFRPDSGDQVKVICGDKDAPVGSPEYKGTIECLWDIFGGIVSSRGYRVLNERVGCILGDGCDYRVIKNTLDGLKQKSFASSNIVFGVGSFAHMASRDSLGIAQKATWAQVGGIGYDLFKAPKTDSGMKKSAKGLLRVDLINGQYILKDCCTKEEESGGELKEVFRDGKLLVDHKLSEIRARVEQSY